MASESPEFKTTRSKFVEICACISEPDLIQFSSELFQNDLITDASYRAAIAISASPPANKVAHLVSEAMSKFCNSPDNFYKFVSILESRSAVLASKLRSDYTNQQQGIPIVLSEAKQDLCTKYVTNLRHVYKTTQPPTWDPLPQCGHVKLAMIKEKGKRYGRDKMIAESRVEGEVSKVLMAKVPVDSNRIFDHGTFDNDCQVILLEGFSGMGKTSLVYQYAHNLGQGKIDHV